MKTLENHTLVYDTECPMCNIYTRAFIQSGMLDKEGRVPYDQLATLHAEIDSTRARDEIALVDKRSGSVYYGLDSLARILVPNFPFIGILLNVSWIKQFFKRFYAFISHNRKVIAPGDIHNQNACVPSEHLGYRLVYLAFTSFVVILILSEYSKHLVNFYPHHFSYQEAMICTGQFVFQGIFLMRYKRAQIMAYFGNMMTVSLLGAIALIPLVWWSGLPEFLYLGYFILVVTLMFFEHVRRVRLLHLPRFLSVTWLTYRILVLLLILTL